MSDVTHEQLEHGHDSNAYGLAIYDPDQDETVEQGPATSPVPMPTVLDPAVQDYERNLYHRLDLPNPDEPGEATGGQPTEHGSDSDSGEQGKSGSSQTEILPTSSDANGETDAPAVLQDIGEVEGNGIDRVKIEAQIAAQHNDLLKEALLICHYEGVPLALRNHPDLLLGLCADYGMDEEKDAEARAHLADWMQKLLGPDVRQQSTYNPTLKANELWVQAHDAYDPNLREIDNNRKPAIANYRAQIEATYDVTFSSIEGADDWDLLRVRMVHVGLEMAAAALGDMVRSLGYYWDDATAFRRIIGDIDLILSGIAHPISHPPTSLVER